MQHAVYLCVRCKPVITSAHIVVYSNYESVETRAVELMFQFRSNQLAVLGRIVCRIACAMHRLG